MALADLDLFEEGLDQRVPADEGAFRATLEKLLHLPVVGDVRGDLVVQLAAPLICGQAEFDEMEQVLRSVLTEAWATL